MSVILEGHLDNASEPPFEWRGTWQFAKEKKVALKFSYQWTSEFIDKDLADFVSFATDLNQMAMKPIQSEIAQSADVIQAAKMSEEIQTQPKLEIKRTHKLLGVWKGSFEVKSAKGEDAVPEVFFFHSLLGQHDDLPEGFKELPPEPQFPFSLLKKSEASAARLQEKTHLQSSAAGEADSKSESVSHEVYKPQGNVVVLVGFGQNAFGRFSVAGLYDESTNSLRCEKKYMVHKFTVKRGRKSYAECAASLALGNRSTGEILGELPHQSIAEAESIYRQHQFLQQQQQNHQFAAFVTRNRQQQNLALQAGGEEDGEQLGKRKRLSGGSSGRKLDGDDYYYYEDHATTHKNIVGGAGQQGSGGMRSSKSNSNMASMSAASIMAAMVPNASNALIGFRDPDSDDPHAEYKEAFQDCDTGEVYEGEWSYGMRHGYGICIYNDGFMYEGHWVLNKEHGKGKLMTGDRNVVYNGDWFDRFMHGFGTYFFPNGDRYTGDWRESHRHGKGDYCFTHGCRYTGDFKDDKRAGKGLFLWPDGSYYDGEWENNMRHGRGFLSLSCGIKYDGYWAANLMEGRGACTFPNGQVYQGTFKNGLREGRGSIQFAEGGAVYEGRFKEDRMDGQGTIKITDNVAGYEEDELFVPIQIQSDLWRIHLKAGFGNTAH